MGRGKAKGGGKAAPFSLLFAQAALALSHPHLLEEAVKRLLGPDPLLPPDVGWEEEPILFFGTVTTITPSLLSLQL